MSDTTEIVADLLAGAIVFEREWMSHTADTMRKAAARLEAQSITIEKLRTAINRFGRVS